MTDKADFPKKKSENRRATEFIGVRCTPEDYNEVVLRAGGGSLAGYLLAAGLDRPKPPAANQNTAQFSPEAMEKLGVAFFHMSRMGGNLNQLAKSANMDCWLEDADVSELQSYYEDFKLICHCMKLALGVRYVTEENSKYIITVAQDSPLSTMETAED